MSDSIKYRKIYGCCKHGNVKGAMGNLVINRSNGEKTPCYRCDICQKFYIDNEKEPLGLWNHSVTNSEYQVWNARGPVPAPEKIYLYDKKSEAGVCSCPGKLKKKARGINHLLLNNGSTMSLNGAKVCSLCGKVFIQSKLYDECRQKLEHNGIRTENNIGLLNNHPGAIDSSPNNSRKRSFDTPLFAHGWENDVFFDERIPETDKNIEELTPANRVACAYLDAKITFNPYQYLPWLKMYINQSQELLISDEVGLGKTIEAGILIMEERTLYVNSKILIICPAFLRDKWCQELTNKFFLDSQIYDGKNTIDSMTSITILPISRLKQYLESGNSSDYSMIIVDEVHYFKNQSSARYKYLSKLLTQIGKCKKVFMSATPVNNSGADYRSIESLFKEKPDRTNTTKKQAYITLPERNIEDIYVSLSADEQKFYDATDSLDPFAGTIYRHIGASCLYALSKYAFLGREMTSETKEELRFSLEQLFDGRNIEEINDDCFTATKQLPTPEVDSKIEKLNEILSSFPSGSKIVIFSHYIETVKYLHSKLSVKYNTGYIYANTISSNIPCRNIRNKFVDVKTWYYQDSKQTTLLICSDTCREGIDLEMANVLINYDLPFNPSILEQRIGRIDRMSQKKDMFIYNFHVKGTYDDRLHFILAAKLRFINYYADYGIGNPLNITSEGNRTFNSFLRYFKQRAQGTKEFALMSNDDYYVASRILKQIGISLNKENFDSLQMQNHLLNLLDKNRATIEKWFDKGEIKKLTEAQLCEQKKALEKKLNFPPKVVRQILMDDQTVRSIVKKANTNPQFRIRISGLINNYADKLREMEITGLPMMIGVNDLRTEYMFGTADTDEFIPSSIIEILRNEGANVYETN